MSVITMLESVPKEIWTAAMGAGFTLLGTWISNRHNEKQNREQRAQDANRHKADLDHDADEKKKQRLADLRHDVYLVAAEELVKANGVMGRLPMTDLTKENVGVTLNPFFVSMMKLQMVGDIKTARLANNLAGTYGELLGRTITAVMPIRNVANTLALRDARYEELQTEINRVLAAMKAHHESGVADAQKFARLEGLIKFNQEQAANVEQEREALRTQGTTLHMQFLKSLPTALKKILDDVLPLLVEIRRELDLEGDLAEFKKILDKQQVRMEGMIAQLESDLNAQATSSPA